MLILVPERPTLISAPECLCGPTMDLLRLTADRLRASPACRELWSWLMAPSGETGQSDGQNVQAAEPGGPNTGGQRSVRIGSHPALRLVNIYL